MRALNPIKQKILPESPILALVTLVDCRGGEIAPLIRSGLLVILLVLIGANRSDQVHGSL